MTSSLQSHQGLAAASSSTAMGVIASIQSMLRASSSSPFGNQIVLGIQQGIGYLLIGTGVAFLTSFARNFYGHVKHSLFVTITVDSKDKTFEALLQWMSNNVVVKRATQLNAEIIYFGTDKNPRVIFVPSVGKHRITYRGKTVWINRIRDTTFDMASGAPFESIELSSFGTNTAVLQSLIDEAMRLSLQRDEGKTVVYINSEGSWTRFGNPRTIRSLSSVILPEKLKDGLIRDIKEFINNETWFRNRGIPYRRGYLLYGPPGNGKSSLVNAIAGELSLDICIVSLSSRDIDDRQINQLLNNAPPKSILLLEDIDAAFSMREKEADLQHTNLTFSGVLNALDGVASQEGRILFMTTNKLEQLDPALIRDGRVDMKIHIQNATKQQSKQLFMHFYNNTDNASQATDAIKEMAEQFASNIVDYQLSMSQIQGFLLQYKQQPEEAVNHAHILRPVHIN